MGVIRRISFDGTGEADIITGLTSPRGIALDVPNNHIYWADPQNKKIQRGNLDGTNVTDLVTGLSSPRTVAAAVWPK